MGAAKSVRITYYHKLESIMNLHNFTGRTLEEWIDPFFQSLTDDYAIPYLLGSKTRYRASPLASSIIWLNNAQLLTNDDLHNMQLKLLFLRDNSQPTDPDLGNTAKFAEDNPGWSLAEGVSVWSTSLALIALLNIEQTEEAYCSQFKLSVIWLVAQRDIMSGGWAYQNTSNCIPNSIMTSLALRAISKAYQLKNIFMFSSDEEREIISSINGGCNYLIGNYEVNNRYSYWKYENKPHVAATTWALSALKEAANIEIISAEVSAFIESSTSKCLRYIISTMPKKPVQWKDEQIVCEAGAKYNKQKNYYSFTCTLLPELFVLGLNPYDTRVVNQIIWILNNPNEWKIKRYDKGKICTFTYAMVVSTIVSWEHKVGTFFASQILQPNPLFRNIDKFILGYPLSNIGSHQLVKKQRLIILLCLLSLIILGEVFQKPIILLLTSIRDFFQIYWEKIAVDFSVELIILVISALVGLTWKLIRKNKLRAQKHD